MCITTECRIDNAANTASETADELQKAMATASPVQAILVMALLSESLSLRDRIKSLHMAMQAEG